MKTNFTLRSGLLMIIILAFTVQGHAQDFTLGNIVVTRVGDGSTVLSSNTAPISLLEYTTTGISQSLPTKTVSISGLTIAGLANEGLLSLSSDDKYLILAGYNAPANELSTSRYVSNLTVTTGGSGYTFATPPTVTISAPNLPGGVNATASANITSGAISSFTIINAGSGYTLAPTVTISGAVGSGATATATISSGGYWQGFSFSKVIARVNNTGAVDATTSFPSSNFQSNGSVKGAVSVNGTSFYLNGARIEYVASLGQTTASTLIFNQGSRSIGIQGGQLYFSSGYVAAASNTTIRYINTSTLPTASATATAVPILPGNQNLGGFYFLDTNPSVGFSSTGWDLLYVAKFDTNGLEKWYYDGTNWVLAASYTAAGSAISSITVKNNLLGQPVIYAVTGNNSVSNNALVAITDTGSRTDAMTDGVNTSFITLATAGANYGFRGVAFAPTSTLGVKSNELDSKIQLWPNPAHSEFNILNGQNAKEGTSTIEISNVNGQIIHSQKSNPGTTTTIKTNGWAKGVYILKATNNESQTTKKLIIK